MRDHKKKKLGMQVRDGGWRNGCNGCKGVTVMEE